LICHDSKRQLTEDGYTVLRNFQTSQGVMKKYKLGEKETKDDKLIKVYRQEYSEILNQAISVSNCFHKYYPSKDSILGFVQLNDENKTREHKVYIIELFAKVIHEVLFNNLNDINNFQLPSIKGKLMIILKYIYLYILHRYSKNLS
jgi:uncharacterized membrane protein YecN with MAPEG domain